jgi:hypothetical protein
MATPEFCAAWLQWPDPLQTLRHSLEYWTYDSRNGGGLPPVFIAFLPVPDLFVAFNFLPFLTLTFVCLAHSILCSASRNFWRVRDVPMAFCF